MSKLHYTEKFYSIQGEGRYMGVPSVFLRMFGCNFRCKNFGRYEKDILGKDTTHNPEVVEIIKNIDQYKSFTDLPLVNTGCDSYSSVYPEFKKFVVKETTEELVNGIMEILPFNSWQDEHLVITGGEPLLGWQRVFPDLLNHPKMQNLKELTFETNGTQHLTSEFRHYLLDWTLNPRGVLGGQRGKDTLTFSVSPKLPCSGEAWEDAIKPDVVCQYEDIGHTYLKFVVADDQDVTDALRAISEYRSHGFKGNVYLMPVGGVESVYALNNRRVAELAMQNGLRYSDRLQVPLFRNEWGT
jgi:7-carboxy-7-deazaguanine synthase